MKYNFQSTIVLRRITVMLLILVVSFVSGGATSQVTSKNLLTSTETCQASISNYAIAQQSEDLSDEEKIKAAIDTYFTIRYEGQKSITEQDFSFLVEDGASDWVKKEKDKREIELYVASLFDLGYQSYKFNLDYDSIEIKENKAIVQLRESHQVVFNALAPEVSMLTNLKHTLTLHNTKDGWVIDGDEYQDELSRQLDHKSKDDVKRQVDENYEKDLAVQQQNSSTSTDAYKTPHNNNPSLTNYTYNRAEAVLYADAHIPTSECPACNYNVAYYKTESADCANYVSQAIYSGGGGNPPDTSAMTTSGSRSYTTDWYYVFNTPMYTTNGSGSLLRLP